MRTALRGLVLLAAAATAPSPAPLGRLIDLGGYKLHLYCTGKGPRTVVFSPGAGDFSFDWSLVQVQVAPFARACSYDRGGEAWSDLGPKPRTQAQEAHDLWRALKTAKENGPFVLVGQSMGGTVVRLFQEQHPKDVAGMVLVDAAHEDSHLFIRGALRKLREMAKERPVPALRDKLGPGDSLTDSDVAGIKTAIEKYEMKPGIDPPYDKLPPEVQSLRLWALGKYSHFAATDNEYGPEEAARMYALRQRVPHPLGTLPLIVLTRSRSDYPKQLAQQLIAEHEAQQKDLASLSENGRQIVVPDSGHHIQLDRPEAVTTAIRELFEQKTGS
jgi:pimeloyl-ACP methyl ester carboxylesterase